MSELTGTTASSPVVTQHSGGVPVNQTSDGLTNIFHLTTTVFNSTTEPIFSTKLSSSSSWTVDELKILGAILWVIIVITIVGNVACFYAVIKNLKPLLQHPFFQSNVFCVYLSFVDVLQIVFVAIPAALSFTTNDASYGNGMYNKAAANPILEYSTWLQLMLVVAICMDRAGHICRPLRYTYNITVCKMVIILATCTAIPFFTMILPYTIGALSAMSYYTSRNGTGAAAFMCDVANEFNDNGVQLISDKDLFMGCVLHVNEATWPEGHAAYQMWMNVAYPLLTILAIAALSVTCVIIIVKLNKSARMQKDNTKRQDEVARSIRLTCTVSFFQAVLILISQMPYHWYSIDDRVRGTKIYTSHYKIIARTLAFLGPIFNPWLYPIRMASIRSFLIKKRKNLASSVNTNLTRLKSSLNIESERNAVNTKLLSDNSTAADKNNSTAL